MGLILITIAISLGPILGIIVIYRNNPQELVIPPNVTEILNGSYFTKGSLTPPKFVGSQYDVASRTMTLTFNFTNPFKFDMKINSMSADVVYAADNYPLGPALLKTPVQLPAGQTALITIVGTWTQDGVNHVLSVVNPGAENIAVNLVGLVIDLDGIKVHINEPVQVPNVPMP